MPANDPRFLDATLEEMAIELQAVQFSREPGGGVEDEDESFDLEAELAKIDAEAEAWEDVSPDVPGN